MAPGEGQWRGGWSRWDDHRPVPCFCPAILAGDSITPLCRHLPPGAGAAGVHPQTQRGLASPGYPDGAFTVHMTQFPFGLPEFSIWRSALNWLPTSATPALVGALA